MKLLDNLPVEIIVGSSLDDISSTPMVPYSPEAISFVTELSKQLLRHAAIRTYPDIAGFAYWCRKSNLSKLAREFDDSYQRLGRGVVFHIAPANVPVNFAFSLIFGLLAGNANIVRIPGVRHPQTMIICEVLSEILKQPAHDKISGMIRVINYPRDDAVTELLSVSCQARVLWGGDETVTHLRAMKSSPRCVDVSFADRYSICLMEANAIISADGAAIERLVNGFYNDVFLLDQNACSSPHMVLWKGDNNRIQQAKSIFWSAMSKHLIKKKEQPAIHAIDKFVHMCRTALVIDNCSSENDQQNLIYRMQLDDVPDDIDCFRGQHGFFFEAIDNDFGVLRRIVDVNYQTVTYFGVDPESIMECVVSNGLSGIDRIVPVGSALDIGVVWDGYDLIGTLSRVISVQ